MRRIAIIGAGPAGCTTAMVLAKMGFEVSLLEISSDILIGGASVAANINHSDGFEYYKSGHQTTGEYCVDGAITKALIYPLNTFGTGICSAENPIRFLVSTDSDGRDGLNRESFFSNAEHMRQRFGKHFSHLSLKRKGGQTQIKRLLGRDPVSFASPLNPSCFSDCANIAYGYSGSGGGVNMARYYAFLKSAIRMCDVNVLFNVSISEINRGDNGNYSVVGSHGAIEVEHVIFTCAHDIPRLSEKINGAEKNAKSPISGTYFLNAMTYVNLPPLEGNREKDVISKINFTLQGEGGAMFACILAPTEKNYGYGAIYYPSPRGSQVQRHLYYPGDPAPPRYEWDAYLKNGLSANDPRVTVTMQQAYRYYPFLENYAEIDKTVCRTVFNASTKDSKIGLERRVRDIVEADILTLDGRVSAFRSPKWTNAELVALLASDHVLSSFGEEPLPKSSSNGYGPTHLDVERITDNLKFEDITIDEKDIEEYSRMNRLPLQV